MVYNIIILYLTKNEDKIKSDKSDKKKKNNQMGLPLLYEAHPLIFNYLVIFDNNI